MKEINKALNKMKKKDKRNFYSFLLLWKKV